MADTKKIKTLVRVGNPRTGLIIAAGVTVDLPTVWADRFIAEGKAEEVKGGKAEKTEDKPKGKKK